MNFSFNNLKLSPQIQGRTFQEPEIHYNKQFNHVILTVYINKHKISKNKVIKDATRHIYNYVIQKYSEPVIYCDIDSTVNNHEIRIKKWSNNGKISKKAFIYDEIMKDLPLNGAIEANHTLYKKYRIYFITARKKFPNAYNSTRDWLNKYNFFYDRIILTTSLEDKINYLKKEGNLKIFIDDCTTNHQGIVRLNTSGIDKIKKESIPLIVFKNNWDDIVKNLYST